MNVFQVMFWVLWAIYAVYLAYVLRRARRRKKEEKSCIYCKHYKGCKELHQIIDEGIPMPYACSDFVRREDGKRWRRPRRRVGKKVKV